MLSTMNHFEQHVFLSIKYMYNLYINISLIFSHLSMQVNITATKLLPKHHNTGTCVTDYLRKCVWLVTSIEGKAKLEKLTRFCILMPTMLSLVPYLYSMTIV